MYLNQGRGSGGGSRAGLTRGSRAGGFPDFGLPLRRNGHFWDPKVSQLGPHLGPRLGPHLGPHLGLIFGFILRPSWAYFSMGIRKKVLFNYSDIEIKRSSNKTMLSKSSLE